MKTTPILFCIFFNRYLAGDEDDDSDDDCDSDDDSDDDLNLHEDEDSEEKFKNKFFEVQESMTKMFSTLPQVPHEPIFSNKSSKPNDNDLEINHQDSGILLRCPSCPKTYKTQGGLSRHMEAKHR